ncbi:MAG: hypothetical protein GX868_10190 [Actinobacteria bacterium]|nr:hypothetical protein [Actinomycetota bacterium]
MIASHSVRRLAATSLAVSLLFTAACGDDASDAATDESTTSTTTADGDSKPADTTGDDAASDTATDEPTDETETTTASPEEMLAWMETATADIEAAADACAVDSVISSGPGMEPSDEATARAAGELLAVAYGKIAKTLTTLDDTTRAKVLDVVEAMRVEAASPDLDVETYISVGPTVVMENDENMAAFSSMMQALGEECA